ncbi:hypothetical protein B0I27_105190 [Arcticibacter pallidicorallinus]|uniref:Uncharacterized protein n=1 Tax=Arcticibacter pallidicorallinus TaxID=1259464 RepID=A0A2T0U499_9SPHI|nr:DUF6088 family protein [Arcticibacter pallidicorallinus]PRY52722.1 hypothetical protein B0I27_105190 [Arcticibacter pallidicorallinus]
MNRLEELKKQLKRGRVYRRYDLVKWSKSVDRHLDALVEEDTLQKLSQGLYYYPKLSAFGKTPPEEDVLIRSFLKDDRFLLTSASSYNSLGVGTQLYNERTVYNHKRHGEFKLGNRKFSFRMKPHFPSKVTKEFLLVDLVNNLETLAEDPTEVLKKIALKVRTMDTKKLKRYVSQYGNAKAKKILTPLLEFPAKQDVS